MLRGTPLLLKNPMSESVRFFLESRVPELEDLFKKGIFSREEIKEIVAKRTKFEHKIKRRGCLLEDFLAYIRYETDLEATRKERMALLKIKGKHTVSDHSIVKSVLSLYRKAVNKFRGCLQLWDQYIAFAQEAKANKAMSKIFASALQMHPENVEIWIRSARWELDQLQNPSSARSLFMRAIRFNKNSLSLWLAYFQMELEVADLLASKRMELADAFVQEATEGDDSLSVFSGAIAISVFKYAVKDCGLTAADAFQFYQMAAKYSERLGAVQNFIYQFVSQPGNFAEPYIFFVSKAQTAISDLSLTSPSVVVSVESCMRELNAALSSSSESLSSKMISAVMDVLRALLEIVKTDEEMRKLVVAKMDRIFRSARDNSCMTAELYVQWIEVFSLEQVKGKDILNMALAEFPEDITLQQLQLSTSKETDMSQVKQTIMTKLTPKSSEFDKVLAEIFSSESASCDDLLDLASASIKNGRPVRECITYVLKHGSLDALVTLVDTTRLQSAFLKVLLICLLDSGLVSKPSAIKFLNKVTVFSSSAYKDDVELCLLLAKAALIACDLELLGRVSSQAARSEEFNYKFEELKAFFY